MNIQQFVDKFLPITQADKNCRFKLEAKEALRKECANELRKMIECGVNGVLEFKRVLDEKR